MTLLEVLKTIRDNGPVILVGGICDNIARIENSRALLDEFKCVYLQWPQYSGRMVFPVPSPNKAYTPGDIYGMADDVIMWSKTDSYGALRWDLLHWSIQFLESQHG